MVEDIVMIVVKNRECVCNRYLKFAHTSSYHVLLIVDIKNVRKKLFLILVYMLAKGCLSALNCALIEPGASLLILALRPPIDLTLPNSLTFGLPSGPIVTE